MWQQYPRELQPVLQNAWNQREDSSPAGSNSARASSSTTIMRWYSENIGTDFYSEYHRYRPDRIQNWSYLQAKEM